MTDKDLERLNDRIAKLEQCQQDMKIEDENMRGRIKVSEKRLEKIDGNIAKAVWIILGTLIAGVISFITGGGISG